MLGVGYNFRVSFILDLVIVIYRDLQKMNEF